MGSPFTSEWEWQAINRGLDYTVVNNAKLQRNNWTLTRFRKSDEAYVSELGDTADELSAFNGGVTETISGVTEATVTGMKFNTTRNWTLNSTIWIETGRIIQGEPSYRMEDTATNIPNATKTNICFLAERMSGVPIHEWSCVEAETADVDDFTWSLQRDDYSNRMDSFDDGPIHNVNFDVERGTFENESRAIEGTFDVVGSFLCTGDNQVYDQASVDWFKQVQTWSFKDSWVTAP